MKNNIILFMIINIILLSLNLVFNIELLLCIFGMIINIILCLIAFLKNKAIYGVFSVIYIYYIIIFIIFGGLSVLTVISFIVQIIYYILCFKYSFNLINNPMNIQFNCIKIPDNKEYLIVNYLLGPINSKSSNGIIIREKDYFDFKIEGKDNEVKVFDVSFSDIDTIKVKEKPYMKPIISTNVSEKDFVSDDSEVDVYKDFKLIPSYEISITLKDKSLIKVVSYNKPNIFE